MKPERARMDEPAQDGTRYPENVAGNYYDKYGTHNPIARRMMQGFLSSFDELVDRVDPRSAFEVGCGEGHLSLRLLERGIAASGVDLEESVVDEANQRAIDHGYEPLFGARSLYDLRREDVEADLVVCCEVLEHVPDPQRALARLHDLANPWALLSVPKEPIWRMLNIARGKYLSAWGNTPGHIQHWSRGAFLRLVESAFSIEEVRSPFPWTMVLARRV